MTEFSDRPFIAGGFIGLRAFNVDKLGRLRGVIHSAVFTPGENVAKCKSDLRLLAGLPQGAKVTTDTITGSAWSSTLFHNRLLRVSLPDGGGERTYTEATELAKDFPPPETDEHDVAQLACACGFYAYFDGANDYHRPDEANVAALVEGYGTCTAGSRGFRASKARLVALVEPKCDSKDVPSSSKKRRLRRAWTVFLVLVNLAMVAYGIAEGSWWPIALNGAGAILCGGFEVLAVRASRKAEREAERAAQYFPTARPLSRERWDLVRRNYPDVPVYPTVEAALAEHPVTPPPAPPVPSPETDADFWTRAS